MLTYVLRRALLALPTLVLVAVAVFLLMRVVPGDPALLALGDSASDASLAELRARMGLDQPLPAQFLAWAGAALRGDLGTSAVSGQAVLPLLLERFQVTSVIVLTAVGLAVLLAVPLGTLAAWRQGKALDLGASVFATLMLSVPAFWLGLLLLLVFGVWLRWLPVVGYVGFTEDPGAALLYAVLPVATLALIEAGVLTRMARASTAEVLRLDYVAHARAKGLPERRVLFRHALPNAFAPTLTLVGVVLGHLLGGAAVIETVFTLPGLGRLLVDAIFQRDYAVVQGCMLFVALAYVLANLLVDLLLPLFDPRVAAG